LTILIPVGQEPAHRFSNFLHYYFTEDDEPPWR